MHCLFGFNPASGAKIAALLMVEGAYPTGRFLVRKRPGSDEDYVLSLNFKNRPTHHLIQKVRCARFLLLPCISAQGTKQHQRKRTLWAWPSAFLPAHLSHLANHHGADTHGRVDGQQARLWRPQNLGAGGGGRERERERERDGEKGRDGMRRRVRKRRGSEGGKENQRSLC